MDTNNQNPYDQFSGEVNASESDTPMGQYSQHQGTEPDPQQNNYYQSNVNQPIYQPNNNIPTNLEEPVSLLDWIGTILIAIIPCAGIIVYIIWAFSKDTKKSKANYCKAMLIMMLVAIVLYIIAIVVFAGFFVSLASYY